MKKVYYFSTRQILITTALLALVIIVVDRFVGYDFLAGRKATDPLNPETQALMRTHGNLLMANADKAVTAAAAAVADKPAATMPASPVAQGALPESGNEAWQTAPHDAPRPSIPLSDRISVYQPVQLDPHPADLPIVGEQVTLPMFNGKKVVAEVQGAVVSENGDYTWRGHLVGQGDDYPVVMTYGEHSTFATITTPEGAYTLESVDGSGWLYKNPSFPELSAPGTNDFLEVEKPQ
jgi:hypothetical protein